MVFLRKNDSKRASVVVGALKDIKIHSNLIYFKKEIKWLFWLNYRPFGVGIDIIKIKTLIITEIDKEISRGDGAMAKKDLWSGEVKETSTEQGKI